MQIVRSARNADNVPIVVQLRIAASQTINVGDLIQINGTSRYGEAAVAASTTIVGIAEQSITTGGSVTTADSISVSLVRGQVVRAAVAQGGTKKTFADTDMYTTAYDLSNKTTVNPDDTTGGMCYVVGYNNTANTVDFIIGDAAIAHVG